MLNKIEERYYTDLINRSKLELDALGIEYAKDITWKTTRSNNNWGTCSYTYGTDKYTIAIREQLLKSHKDKEIMDTIIHELLHSVEGCMSHTGKWARLAEVVNANTNFNIKRRTTPEAKGLDIPYKYKVTCDGCNHIYYYQNSAAKIIKRRGIGFRCSCGCTSFSGEDNKGNKIF